jgi:hypothetical protein
MFSNNPTELDAFLSRFEVVAKAYELPTKLWAVEFSKTLSGVSLEAFEMLSPSERLDYDLLVQALKNWLINLPDIGCQTFKKSFFLRFW